MPVSAKNATTLREEKDSTLGDVYRNVFVVYFIRVVYVRALHFEGYERVRAIKVSVLGVVQKVS